MINKFILIKSQESILSPYLVDFFKGFLGNDIKIEESNNIISIFYSLDDRELVYDGLLSLIGELDKNVKVVLSNSYDNDYLMISYEIIKDYFIQSELSESIYKEEEFLLHLVLNGKIDNLDKVVFKSLSQDKNMLECIKVFIENDMNTTKTANILYLHRNTLINKIDKFNDITGYNVKKFKDAMIIYHILKK
ncbi:MAG: helix-turn-helix domain-containing protein [Anaeroplasmataceae bacterium]